MWQEVQIISKIFPLQFMLVHIEVPAEFLRRASFLFLFVRYLQKQVLIHNKNPMAV